MYRLKQTIALRPLIYCALPSTIFSHPFSCKASRKPNNELGIIEIAPFADTSFR